jgi:thiamine pyrophosphate-dependent acetolactate synthase large subunit-like protein
LGPDLKQLAALAGIPFMRVSEASTLGVTLSKALTHKGVTLVEVAMNSIGEFPPYFPYSKK